MSPKPGWQNYQDKVAAFLLQMGYDVKVDEAIQGARAQHKIDVTARMNIAGVEQCWLIECKSWNRKVPKERVLTFRGVVEDIGGDRGLLFSESGFQAGAISAVQNTNITLTSLEDFEGNFSAEISSMRAKVLDEKIAGLMQAFTAIWDLPESERAVVFARYSGPSGFPGLLEGTPHAVVGMTAPLSQMRQALEDARFNRWPVIYYPLGHADGEFFQVSSWEGLLFIVERTVITCERIYSHMTTLDAGHVEWRELQPPDLVELLDGVRNPDT